MRLGVIFAKFGFVNKKLIRIDVGEFTFAHAIGAETSVLRRVFGGSLVEFGLIFSRREVVNRACIGEIHYDCTWFGRYRRLSAPILAI